MPLLWHPYNHTHAPQKSGLLSTSAFTMRMFQGKTPWVDSACADCPGSLVPGATGAGFQLHLGASDCAPELAFCFMGPWTFAWICCAQLPYHPCKNGTHTTIGFPKMMPLLNHAFAPCQKEGALRRKQRKLRLCVLTSQTRALLPRPRENDKNDENGGRHVGKGMVYQSMIFRDGKGAPKNLCDKNFAELSGELSGAICLKTLILLVTPSNCSANSLVLFVRFFGFGVLFWLLRFSVP